MEDLSTLFPSAGQILRKIENTKARVDAIETVSRGALFLGDNFTVMCGLLKNYASKIDLVYIDPPYNTKLDFYYSEKKTSHISHGRDSIVAYNDSMDFNSYLEFIRERIVLLHMLLSECGTLYFHIDVAVCHYAKIILDSVFGRENFVNEITRVKSNPKNFARRAYGNVKDTILVYAKKSKCNIFNDITAPLSDGEINGRFKKIDAFGRRYTTVPCHAPGETKNGATGAAWRGIAPPPGRHWRRAPERLEELDRAGAIEWSHTNVPRIKIYADENGGKKIQDVWLDFKDPPYPVYPTEKNMKMLELIVRQSSNASSLIMDCFCGSGSFLAVGLRLGRRVIGIDKSETAIRVASQRPKLSQLPVMNMLVS